MSSFSYKKAGIDISATDRVKARMKKELATRDKRVLNSLGAFASLFEARFPGIKKPVLVLKTEEPGSKQLLAFQHDKIESVCADTINHLINDIAVMGATPLAVQDAIICGTMDPKIVERIVRGFAAACRAQGCTLTGGETSVQPGVINPGTYILTTSIVGVVEKNAAIDGRKIRKGDRVIAVSSNGLHTNGYTLVRNLLKAKPELAKRKLGKATFLEVILKPHLCYYQALKGLYRHPGLHGMAHITGGGIQGNLNRILPENLGARIDLSAIAIHPVFPIIRDAGAVSDREMLRTFNLGVGLTIVAAPSAVTAIRTHLRKNGHKSAVIGEIVKGSQDARFEGKLQWA